MAERDSGLRVDTNLTASYSIIPSAQELSPSPKSPKRDQSGSASRGLPSFRLPSGSGGQSESSSRPTIPPGAARARHESRKLLAHVLSQLQHRSLPPSAMPGLYEQSSKVERGLGAVVRSFASIAGAGSSAENRPRGTEKPEDTDDEDEDQLAFHTDMTLDLMIQLKDVLAISIAQGWDIFYEDADAIKKQGRPISFDKPRRRRRRSSNAGRSRSRSRSVSPTREESIAAPELLSQCVSILASVVTEDCRYQVSLPSPRRPPNALQSVTLDVAQVLIYTHQHEPRIVSDIGFAVLPAFQTFRPSMHARLLAFFEERVLGGMLENLLKIQGSDTIQSPTDATFDEPQTARPPVVSIMVDEVHEDPNFRSKEWRRWSTSSEVPGTQSARAPEQSIAVYYLSSLVAPLLASILEYVDLSSNDGPTTQRFHRFFRVLIQRKPDAYLDLLEAIAYHTSKVRYAGLSILTTYWPKAVGHVMLSKPITSTNSDMRDRADRRSSLTRRTVVEDHPYAHQFVPWRFDRQTQPSFFEGLSPYDCRICFQRIEGFGILCPFCMCAVHFDCYDYPDGSFFTQYSVDTDVDIQKVAVHRFCHILTNVRTGLPSFVRREQHIFRMVNIFSMSLCFLCHQPLWGYIMQGLKCSACRQFVHASCLSKTRNYALPRCRSSTVDPASMTISHASLRSSFLEHYRDVIFTESELDQRTHEEISVYHAVLWLQLQLLENGIALGSIVVTEELINQPDEDEEIEEFELHELVRLYETYLVQAKLPISNTIRDYLSENEAAPQDRHVFFDWNILAFVASSLKLPALPNESGPAESMQLLSVSQLNNQEDDGPDVSAHPLEVVTLAHLRDQLGDVLNMHSDVAARHFLILLHHLGLLQRLDTQTSLFDDTPQPERLRCCLPLPFGFDISADVETLVASIEACLSDINLTVNELGFLLLIRRFWPNGMLSDYTFRRLTKAILGWVLSEANNLAIILRTYVARGRDLPGVRSGEPQPWPPEAQGRPTATGAPGNGGDYVATRRALLSRYVAPWMLALHDHDILSYATTVFDVLTEFAEEHAYWDVAFLGERSEQQIEKEKVSVTDRVLRSIVKVCQANIVFTVFDDLFQRWLERADTLEDNHEPLPSLLRLFSREGDSSQRHTLVLDSRFTMGDLSSLANINPLQVMTNLATTTKSGYERGLHWLNLFATSGVDIPIPIFMQFAVLANAALAAAYLRPIGRLDLQPMISLLHTYLSQQILNSVRASENIREVLVFVRRSLAVCLLLYGCERKHLVELQMIQNEEVMHLPSRRKVGSRASTLSDPIIVDAKLMAVLKSYVDQQFDDLSCLVAKFLDAFVNGTPLVESYEYMGILWHTATRAGYASPRAADQSLGSGRTAIPSFDSGLETVLRLFRIILDVTSPAFVVEDRQWGPNVIDVFHYFFSSVWDDEREEVRTAVDTWSQTLLPAHFDAIAKCWNEALSKAPVSERVRLIRFLLQLRSHFPKWRVLSWETIIETLLDNEFMEKNGNDEDAAVAAHLSMYGLSSREPSYIVEVDPELTILRIGLLSLSLKMIADGLSVDLFTLLRLKDQLARTFGYQDVTAVPSSSGHTFHIQFKDSSGAPAYSYPCITDLMFLLDAPHSFSLASSAMGGPNVEDDTPAALLVGSLFLDLVIGLFLDIQEFSTLPPMTLKNLVKCLLIALQKHDFDSQPLRHLQPDLRRAVKRSLVDLVKDNCVSYEIRQLALSICQVFVKRFPHFAGKFIHEAIEEVTNLMIQLNYLQKPDDVLVVQAKIFMEALFAIFAMSGVLNMLFKNTLDQPFFQVLRYVLEFNAKSNATAVNQVPLRETLLRDTLSRAAESEPETCQLLVENLSQYVEIVYHSHYSADLLGLVGSSLLGVARKASESPGMFDASPLLVICCNLIQHNKSQSRYLLSHLDNLLRVALVRLYVTPASLTRILRVTAALYRKVPRDQAFTSNIYASVVFELLADALHAKLPMTPPTLAAVTEALIETADTLHVPAAKLSELAFDGLRYFHHGCSPEAPPQDFSAAQAVVKMVLEVAQQDSQIITNLSARPLSVRVWNVMLLGALSMDNSRCASLLLQNLQEFSRAYYMSLNPGTPAAPDYQALQDVDISRAYIAIKLWLILARKVAQGQSDDFDTSGFMDREDLEDRNARSIWNQLWPPFEAALTALEHDGFATSSLMLVSTSVADLFLFLHQFRSVLSLASSSQIALLNRLRSNGRVESKISRTLRALNEPPPDVGVDFFVDQATAEIVAEEKLLMEAAKLQDPARGGTDRTRRAMPEGTMIFVFTFEVATEPQALRRGPAPITAVAYTERLGSVHSYCSPPPTTSSYPLNMATHAGIKTVILLSFVLAVGFLMIILSCALWSNWLPLLVALTFVLAPLPNAIFSHCGNDDFTTDYEGSGPIDLGRFITATVVVTGFALPLVLTHSDIIRPGACAMSIIGGALVYGTILAYSSVFKQEEADYD
ncbi:hypothetical protein NM688_g537 [Phlebia brevispora]|uniref:Uncharacterized protein n=1 Tax=Phlebia brevispora TaxID=194682 RepID=A0ACC1TDR7_9APHY|nr:hypothetical protein NM688_g537 [Phlebia brevispora]